LLKSRSLTGNSVLPQYVRRMKREDIDAVLTIDREAFPTEWPPPNLRRELDNRLAHYIVACDAEELVAPAEEAAVPAKKGLAGIVSRLRRWFSPAPEPLTERRARGPERIIGFAGIWVMADEAHVTTIATRADDRRQGIGELLLQSIVHLAATLHATIVTLEVRVSNGGAQSLYTRYGFRQVGLRRGYYTDNREDAMLMSTENIGAAPFRTLFGELTAAYRQRWGPERYQLGS
jgi:ribosomal-protein-alanine N-acetyltransferase